MLRTCDVSLRESAHKGVDVFGSWAMSKLKGCGEGLGLVVEFLGRLLSVQAYRR